MMLLMSMNRTSLALGSNIGDCNLLQTWLQSISNLYSTFGGGKDEVNPAYKILALVFFKFDTCISPRTIPPTSRAFMCKKLGEIIANAFRAVDNTGVVMMEVSASGKTEVEVVEGVQYDKGLTNSHFITNKQNKTAELENPLVLLVCEDLLF